jgi:hypothetical protein
MIIRREQVEALAAAATRDYIKRTVRQCRDRLTPLVSDYTDDDLLSLVSRGVESAGICGIETEKSVWRYIHLVLECGDASTMRIETAWAVTILAATYLDGDQKMASLWQRYRTVRRAAAGA